MPRPRAINLLPTAISPPPINALRPLAFPEAATARSAPGILSISAWPLSEGPSLRRKPRMMPMVFSATALSMPAFAASCSTSSSILPRPRPVVTGCLLVVLSDWKSTRLNSSHTDIYTLSLHDALPICDSFIDAGLCSQLLNEFVHIAPPSAGCYRMLACRFIRLEEHTSELQSHRYLHSFPTRRSSDLRQLYRCRPLQPAAQRVRPYCPALGRLLPDACLSFHLDLLLNEIQSMTSGKCKIHIRWHGKCCNAARVTGNRGRCNGRSVIALW